MPNWCSCDLEIMGPAAAIQKIRDLCPVTQNEDADAPGTIPICNLFPTPEELTNIHVGSTKLPDGTQLTNWRETPDGPVAVDSEALQSKYGFSNWYDWNIANWGTKWSFSLHEGPVDDPALYPDPDQGYLTGTFESAWSPPLSFFEKVSADFPECTFTLRYFECGMGFQGLVIFEAGETTEEYSSDYRGSRGG